MGLIAQVKDTIPAVQAGVYPARYDGTTSDRNDQGEFWLWTFTLQVPGGRIMDVEQYGEDDAIIPLTGTSSPRLTPRTKGSKWLAGIRGREVEVGESIDFDEYKGTLCQVVTIVTPEGYSRIESVLPRSEGPLKVDSE
jgi:hypothetical protein